MRPSNEVEYIEWCKSQLGYDYNDKRIQQFYLTNAGQARNSVERSDFFGHLGEYIKDCEEEYFQKTKAHLLMSSFPPDILQKNYSSVVNKTFRLNVVWNRKFPEPPPSFGWIIPTNIFFILDDIIRTTLICKFIDGPKFLAEKLEGYSDSLGLKSSYQSREIDVGYYAYHFNVIIPLELSDLNWEPMPVDLHFEIQLSTQLQEVLYQITHQFYASTRDKIVEDRSAWKWDIESNRFKAGYVSHTLHLLEAIILQLRNDSIKADTGTVEAATAARKPEAEAE